MTRQLLIPAIWCCASACMGSILGSDGDEGGSGGGPEGGQAGTRGPGSPGSVGDSPGSTPGTGGATGTAPGGAAGSAGTLAPPGPSRPAAPLRRLTRAQYNNTVRDLLGDTSRPADAFVSEDVEGYVGGAAMAQVSATQVDQYRGAAERLAASAVRNLGRVLPCTPQAGAEETCARTFIEEFGLRAYRRPLAAAETTSLLELYRKSRVDGDFTYGIQSLLEALLQSPHFVYRLEPQPAGAAVGSLVPLGPYQVAARLSYALWNTMPDRELFDAAKAGKLSTVAEVEAQARRMLRDPRARDVVGVFFEGWLALGRLEATARDAKLFPEFTEELKRAMREETLRFGNNVILDGDGKLETLLGAPRSFVNVSLGKLYGVSGTADYAATDLNPNERAGLLTHASVLTLNAHADTTSPTLRGKFVRENVMCQPPPPPPPNVDTALPRPKAGQTARERFKVHVENPSCGSCHALIDPIGFGFENYNAIGKFQTLDAGKPIDASGEITGSTPELNGPFVGAVALAKRLIASSQVRLCLAKQWFEFTHGRPDAAGDEASLRANTDAFEKAGANVKELLIAMTRSDAFRMRVVEAAP